MRRIFVLLLVAPSLVLAASVASAEESCCPQTTFGSVPDCTCRADYEVSLDLGVYSRYVWRGVLLTDGFVVQPAMEFSSHGFGLSVWGNYELEDVNGQEFDFTEIDLTASYGITVSKFDLLIGTVTYLFPTGGVQTTEVFAGVTWNVPLAPTVTVFQDIDDVDGTYVTLSGSYTFDDPFCLGACRGVSPELSASVSWGSSDFNDIYYGNPEEGFADLTLGLTVPYRISRWATVRASVHWSSLLDDGNRDATSDPDNFWFGIGIGWSL